MKKILTINIGIWIVLTLINSISNISMLKEHGYTITIENLFSQIASIGTGLALIITLMTVIIFAVICILRILYRAAFKK